MQTQPSQQPTSTSQHATLKAPTPARSDRTTADSAAPVRTAVILAAGSGLRIQTGRKPIAKAMFKVGGLHLIERSILALKQAGIERFRVVVGAHAEVVRSGVQGLARLQDLNIEFVSCDNYELGNGVSLGAGAAPVNEAFVLTMADHVFTGNVVSQLLEGIKQAPHLPHLTTDPRLAEVFDMEDATKVATDNQGHIKAISKTLTTYDQVDTGLFYFPAGAGPAIGQMVADGARSVSDVVTGLMQRAPFGTVPLTHGMWQDVDTPDMAKEAERRLLQSLKKPTDGPVSKYLNRAGSLAVSRWLARWRVTPNAVTTGVTLITLVGAAMATSTNYWWVALAGIIFQVASVLDGCDGEVARLTFMHSRYGAWYDTLSDNARYAIFFCCLGVGAYRGGGGEIYLWAIALLASVYIFTSVSMARYVWQTQDHLTNLAVTAKVKERSKENPGWWDKYIIPLEFLVKQDSVAFIAMALCLAALPHVMFWASLVGICLVGVSVLRVLGKENHNNTAANGSKRASNPMVFMFYLLGLGILGFLLSRMPLQEVSTALQKVGAGVFIAFATAPLWYFANALCLHQLVGGRIGIVSLFYNQLVAEAINALIPMAGLGGDPYKITHLRQWLTTSQASQVIVQDRLLHALSGPLFGGVMLALTAWLIPLGPTYQPLVITFAILGIVAGLAFSVLTLSPLPPKLTGYVLRRLNIPQQGDGHGALPMGLFLRGLFFKMVGRTLGLVEIWVILVLLGLEGNVGQVVAVSGLLTASGVIFFVIPQGLGVAEAGITGAFALIGLSPALGLTFGLIRRGRIIFWAIAGLAIHLAVKLAGIRPVGVPAASQATQGAPSSLGSS